MPNEIIPHRASAQWHAVASISTCPGWLAASCGTSAEPCHPDPGLPRLSWPSRDPIIVEPPRPTLPPWHPCITLPILPSHNPATRGCVAGTSGIVPGRH